MRQRVLDAAYDHGMTHFDTAPYYAFGIAERELAPLLARHPGASVTTKVGIYSPGGEAQSGAAVFARKAIGRVLQSSNRPTHDSTVDRAKRSLDASLRRLGRDHVELYMLHEPDWASLRCDEWLRWLEDEIAGGRIGNFGVAGEAERVAPFLAHSSRLAAVVQTSDSIDRHEPDLLSQYARPLQITYGYVSAAMSRDKDAVAEDILKEALRRNESGAVIVSTRRPERMRQYAALDAAS